MQMTREEFKQLLDTELQRVQDLFNLKNQSYGNQQDLFHNFRQSAMRIFNDEAPHAQFSVLMTLADKHWVALANKGLDDRECEDRLRDMIVYCLIGLAMKEATKKAA